MNPSQIFEMSDRWLLTTERLLTRERESLGKIQHPLKNVALFAALSRDEQGMPPHEQARRKSFYHNGK